jgi:hypothetical protein
MVNITYTSSAGEVFDLIATKLGRLKTAAFHSFEWVPEITERQYGAKVSYWRRDPAEYECQLVFIGSEEDRRKALDAFHSAIEGDFFRATPGLLTWGEAYIPCFIRVSATEPADRYNFQTYNNVTIYCPDPFWTVEQLISIAPVPTGETHNDDKQYTSIGYGYTPGYRYPIVAQARSYHIDHFAPCDFRMIAYGPTASVSVSIAGHLYAVQHQISDGEYLVIDSRETQPDDRHCYLISANGVITNCFNDRNPDSLLLQQIPSGDITINYSQEYGIDLTLYKRRSEPAWT